MWPKAIAQLVELAPHVSRLLPLADRFLKDKAASETATQQTADATQKAMDAHRQSLDSMATGLRTDLGQLATFHAGLQTQMAELDKHLSSTRADALASKLAAESLQARLTGIEQRQRQFQILLGVALLVLATILFLLLLPYVHGR